MAVRRNLASQVTFATLVALRPPGGAAFGMSAEVLVISAQRTDGKLIQHPGDADRDEMRFAAKRGVFCDHFGVAGSLLRLKNNRRAGER